MPQNKITLMLENERHVSVVYIAFSLLVVLFLSSCSDTQNLVRLSDSPPNEFAVIRKEPLVLPPNFNLRPPSDKKIDLSEDSSVKAKRVLTSSNLKNVELNAENLTDGDLSLLNDTGYKNTKSNIRELLETENEKIIQNMGRVDILVEKLVGSLKDDSEILDPSLEVKRNQERIATGRSVSKAQQPVTIRKINN